MPLHRSIVLLLLAWVTATGQQLFTVRPVSKPDMPLGETKIVADIAEPKLNGTALAALYRKFTGRRVIVSAAAAAAEFSVVQAASPKDPLTYAQAAEVIRKSAGSEGFVFLPDTKDADRDFLTVCPRPVCGLIDVYNEDDTLPEGDAVITYVMTLKHITPVDAAAVLTKRIGALGTYGSIAPLNSAVVITENLSVIRKLIEFKKEIDKP